MYQKLRQPEEREAAIAFLCGANRNELASRYGICTATLQLINRRSKSWDDKLVEFYRNNERQSNAAHLYLSMHGQRPDPHLAIRHNDRIAYHTVGELVFGPRIDKVIEKLGLGHYTNSDDPYEIRGHPL